MNLNDSFGRVHKAYLHLFLTGVISALARVVFLRTQVLQREGFRDLSHRETLTCPQIDRRSSYIVDAGLHEKYWLKANQVLWRAYRIHSPTPG